MRIRRAFAANSGSACSTSLHEVMGVILPLIPDRTRQGCSPLSRDVGFLQPADRSFA
ncbi:hypothetical protein ACFPM0_31125 [Pseudonocardia sulfidoxydans]|uniref:hypothetical protein n=1 Tax=Pseudonocardia sulfidoxydans TaxID=54011 RepID=UPI003623C570